MAINLVEKSIEIRSAEELRRFEKEAIQPNNSKKGINAKYAQIYISEDTTGIVLAPLRSWQKFVSAIANIYRVALKIINKKEDIQPENDTDLLVICAHGSSSKIELSKLKGTYYDTTDVKPETFNKLNKNAKILLYSCETGFGEDCIAQRIAIVSQRTVFAPFHGLNRDHVWFCRCRIHHRFEMKAIDNEKRQCICEFTPNFSDTTTITKCLDTDHLDGGSAPITAMVNNTLKEVPLECFVEHLIKYADDKVEAGLFEKYLLWLINTDRFFDFSADQLNQVLINLTNNYLITYINALITTDRFIELSTYFEKVNIDCLGLILKLSANRLDCLKTIIRLKAFNSINIYYYIAALKNAKENPDCQKALMKALKNAKENPDCQKALKYFQENENVQAARPSIPHNKRKECASSCDTQKNFKNRKK